MTLVSSRPLAPHRRERLDGPPPLRAGRPGKRGTAPRLGLLRLAPRLSIVSGNRRDANWPVIAGGVGAAMTDWFDPDDGPLCA
jgi:hypothetical protein